MAQFLDRGRGHSLQELLPSLQNALESGHKQARQHGVEGIVALLLFILSCLSFLFEEIGRRLSVGQVHNYVGNLSIARVFAFLARVPVD